MKCRALYALAGGSVPNHAASSPCELVAIGGRRRKERPSRRGMAYVEVLVLVGIVVTLGLLAVGAIGRATAEAATKEGDCIRTLGCGPGRSGGSGGAGGVGTVAAAAGTGGEGSFPPTSSGSGGFLSAAASTVGSFINGAVLGDFSSDDSLAATAGAIVAGELFPVTDVRDTAAAVSSYLRGEGSAGNIAISAAGIVPFVSSIRRAGRVVDAVDAGRRTAAHGAATVVRSAYDGRKAPALVEAAAQQLQSRRLAAARANIDSLRDQLRTGRFTEAPTPVRGTEGLMEARGKDGARIFYSRDASGEVRIWGETVAHKNPRNLHETDDRGYDNLIDSMRKQYLAGGGR